MTSTVEWKGGLEFAGTFSSGHAMTMDVPEDRGGTNKGPRPVEMLLMGLAGCTGIDVIEILRKKRQRVSSFKVLVSGERREAHPRIFETIRIVYEVAGEELDPNAIRQAVALSEEKYCSVSAMLRQSAALTTEIRIVP
ncbi:MAG: OsmC family protein [Candidatus Eisenbacteria bacterium]|nr:OsmC family protein [Candidatus Eisenbacteria bacterium]